MSVSINNSLIGLSLLTGAAPASLSTTAVGESRAVRLAKAQFGLKPVTPPWKEAGAVAPEAVRLSTVKRMATVIDSGNPANHPPDVLTAFTTYKALDRLRLLASSATKPNLPPGERSALQAAFAKGLGDLQQFMASAPADRLNLFFSTPSRKAESITLQTLQPTAWSGRSVAPTRNAALSGLTGREKFELIISGASGSDHWSIDLSAGPQPPTLDSIAAALNGAIAAVPRTDANGVAVRDAQGNVRPKWSTSFAVVKGTDGWSLELRTSGVEEVRLEDRDARDGLMMAVTQTVAGQPSAVTLSQAEPNDISMRTALGFLPAADGFASAAARLLPQPVSPLGSEQSGSIIAASVAVRASAADKDGFTYMVGTSSGDVGTHIGDDADDLILSKVDSRGEVIWQRSLGTAGVAEGAAVSLGPDGSIVVAGTVIGKTDGIESDGDMLVARFSASGVEQFARVVRAVGADQASSVAVAANGTIIVGGRNAAGEAALTRLDGSGRVLERRVLDPGTSGFIRDLAVDADGSVLVLSQAGNAAALRRLSGASLDDELNSVALSDTDARCLAMDGDGHLAIASTKAVGETRNIAVTYVAPDFSIRSTTELGSSGDDQVDSLQFLDGKLYVGGRTSGDLGGIRSGLVDAFVARLDVDAGEVERVAQWGRSAVVSTAVQLSTSAAAISATGALGFRNGLLNPESSLHIAAQTSLRAGDTIRFRVNNGVVRSVSVAASDTLDSFAARVARTVGSKSFQVGAVKGQGGYQLRMEAAEGHEVELLSGPSGWDALPKLGLAPVRLVGPALSDPRAPRVKPGGSYGLELSPALNLQDGASAKVAMAKVQNAISTTQSAFRSLFWDDNKAAIVDGTKTGTASPYQAAQLARYRDALSRLSGGY